MAEITIRISDKAPKATLVVFCAIAFVWALFYVGSLGVFRPKYQIEMFVPEAQGISVGTPVRLNGIPIGSVSKLQLATDSADPNRRIELRLRIEKRFQDMIRSESSASLATEGLLGSRYVNIDRGFTGPPINSGGEIRVALIKEIHFTDLINSDFIKAIGQGVDCLNSEKNDRENKPPAGIGRPNSPRSQNR